MFKGAAFIGVDRGRAPNLRHDSYTTPTKIFSDVNVNQNISGRVDEDKLESRAEFILLIL